MMSRNSNGIITPDNIVKVHQMYSYQEYLELIQEMLGLLKI